MSGMPNHTQHWNVQHTPKAALERAALERAAHSALERAALERAAHMEQTPKVSRHGSLR